MFISEGNHLVYMGALEYYFRSHTWFVGILASCFFRANNMLLAVNYHVNSQQCEKGLCAPNSASLLRVRFSLPSRLSPKQVSHGKRQQRAWGTPGDCCRCNLHVLRACSAVTKVVFLASGEKGGGWVACSDKFSVSVFSM